MPKQQLFKSVIVRSSDIGLDDLKATIDDKYMALELAKLGENKANMALQNASADLLEARANRMRAMAALQSAFAEGDTRVALEPNWEFFRNEQGVVCAENYLSERDQRNMARVQRAHMNKTAEELNIEGEDELFEKGSE